MAEIRWRLMDLLGLMGQSAGSSGQEMSPPLLPVLAGQTDSGMSDILDSDEAKLRSGHTFKHHRHVRPCAST
jgi:hypothetical protein